MNILGMLKNIGSALLSSGNSKSSQLTDQQAIAAVDALSNSNKKAISFAKELAQGITSSDASSIFLHNFEEMRPFTIIAASLEASGQIEMLDWADELEDAALAFSRLFETAGIDSSPIMAKLLDMEEPKRGEAVEAVYASFRELADRSDRRIIGLNANSDAYLFVLALSAGSEPWLNVEIDTHQFIEDSDWQFSKALTELGLEVRSHKHPMTLKRPPPSIA